MLEVCGGTLIQQKGVEEEAEVGVMVEHWLL
jgi:hypothetical protein